MLEEETFDFKGFFRPSCSGKTSKQTVEDSSILDLLQTRPDDRSKSFISDFGLIKYIILLSIPIYGLMFLFTAVDSFTIVFTASESGFPEFKPGATQVGVHLYIFLFNALFSLFLGLLLILYFVGLGGRWIGRRLSRFRKKRETKEEDKDDHYLIRITKQIQAKEGAESLPNYFNATYNILEDEDFEDDSAEWGVELKRAKIYWNPSEIFTYFYGDNWRLTIATILGVWFILGAVFALTAAFFSTEIVLKSVENTETSPFGFFQFADNKTEFDSDIYLFVGSVALFLGLYLLVPAIWKSFVFYFFMRDFRRGFDRYYSSLQESIFTEKPSTDNLFRLQTVQNVRTDLYALPRHPLTGLIGIAGVVPIVLGIFAWLIQNFL